MLISISSGVVLVLSSFQDSFGRKLLIVLVFIFAVVGIACVFWGNSLWVAVAGMILLWSFVEVTYVPAIVLSNELLVNPVRKYAQNFFSMLSVIGGVLSNFLTHYFDTYQSFMMMIFVCHLAGLFLILFLLPESPSFLLKQLKYGKLKQVMTEISKFSGLAPAGIEQVLSEVDSVIECNVTTDF